MKNNLQPDSVKEITTPNLSLPSDFNIIKEEDNFGETYYREISLSHLVVEICLLESGDGHSSARLISKMVFFDLASVSNSANSKQNRNLVLLNKSILTLSRCFSSLVSKNSDAGKSIKTKQSRLINCREF